MYLVYNQETDMLCLRWLYIAAKAEQMLLIRDKNRLVLHMCVYAPSYFKKLPVLVKPSTQLHLSMLQKQQNSRVMIKKMKITSG